MTAALPGETLAIAERVIVSPGVGIFRPRAVEPGAILAADDEIGVIEAPGTATPIRSAFDGTLMGMLALDGERLRAGQVVAWLRLGELEP